MPDFYDELAPLYHLVHEDWNRSVRRQGEQLSRLIRAEWPAHEKVLDVTCGIGTQAIALAVQGFSVTGSDLSAKEIERARQEARRWGVNVSFSVCDMREAAAHHGRGFDMAISCDNSVPHLLSDAEILVALKLRHINRKTVPSHVRCGFRPCQKN